MLTTTAGGVVLIAVLMYLVYRVKKQDLAANRETDWNLLANFKKNAISIKVDFNDCEFKNSSYTREPEQNTSNEALALHLYRLDLGMSQTAVKKQHISNSVLYYNYKGEGKQRTLLQAFPVEETVLKLHVLQGHMNLYVDPADNNSYYFEIEEASAGTCFP